MYAFYMYINYMHTLDVLTRNEHPRMPWHDIACCMYGEPARDVARHFIQRFNFTKVVTPVLLPCVCKIIIVFNFQREQGLPLPVPFLLPRRQFTEEEVPHTSYLHIPNAASTGCTCQVRNQSTANIMAYVIAFVIMTFQVLRSVSRWSAAVEDTELSIMHTYLHYIENSEHFIYIEVGAPGERYVNLQSMPFSLFL